MRTGSCKLSYDICNKLFLPSVFVMNDEGQVVEENNVTGTEIDLLISLSLKQNALGKVDGVYYKDIMLDLMFRSQQTFYNCLKGLEDKGYIKITKFKGKYWSCTILNNVFLSDADDKKGYFNTNREFLHSPEFRKLKRNEKKLCIKLAITYQENHCNKFGFSIYPSKMAKWIGLKTVSLIYGYMENINQFFPNKIKKGVQGCLIHFTKGNHIPFKSTNKTEREHYLMHKIMHFCSEYKIAYTLKDLKDLIILLAQYASKGIGKLHSTVCNVLLSNRSIEPALINKLLSNPY